MTSTAEIPQQDNEKEVRNKKDTWDLEEVAKRTPDDHYAKGSFKMLYKFVVVYVFAYPIWLCVFLTIKKVKNQCITVKLINKYVSHKI